MFSRKLLSWLGRVSRSFVSHLKSFSVSIGTLSGEHLAGDIVKAFGIVAFLFAADYFTAKPSVNTHVWGERKVYYQSSLLSFFSDNQIKLPSVIANSFVESDIYPQALIYPQRPVIEYIREVLQNEDYSPFGMVPLHRDELEKNFDSYRYEKHVYMSPDRGNILTDDLVNELLCCVERVNTPAEYLTVLAALIHSRTFSQQISVKNDGDVDLRDIDVTVPAPLSRISQRRVGNIVDYTVMGNMLYDIEEFSDRIKLHIPRLKQGQFVGIQVITRENQLMDADLLCTFESDQEFNLIIILAYVFGILFVQWLIRWLCHRRVPRRPTH